MHLFVTFAVRILHIAWPQLFAIYCRHSPPPLPLLARNAFALFILLPSPLRICATYYACRAVICRSVYLPLRIIAAAGAGLRITPSGADAAYLHLFAPNCRLLAAARLSTLLPRNRDVVLLTTALSYDPVIYCRNAAWPPRRQPHLPLARCRIQPPAAPPPRGMPPHLHTRNILCCLFVTEFASRRIAAAHLLPGRVLPPLHIIALLPLLLRVCRSTAYRAAAARRRRQRPSGHAAGRPSGRHGGGPVRRHGPGIGHCRAARAPGTGQPGRALPPGRAATPRAAHSPSPASVRRGSGCVAGIAVHRRRRHLRQPFGPVPPRRSRAPACRRADVTPPGRCAVLAAGRAWPAGPGPPRAGQPPPPPFAAAGLPAGHRCRACAAGPPLAAGSPASASLPGPAARICHFAHLPAAFAAYSPSAVRRQASRRQGFIRHLPAAAAAAAVLPHLQRRPPAIYSPRIWYCVAI